MKARFLGGALAVAVLAAIVLAACGTEPGEGASPSSVTMGERQPADRREHVDPTEVSEAPALGSAAGPHARKARADGLLPGMVRFRGGPNQDANPICANPQLTYFGGPILQSPTLIAVFWTGTVNATLQANIGQFYADVTLSSYWPWLHEYDTVGLTPGTNQAVLPGTFGGGFAITPLVCAPGGNNCKLSDAQLQAELARQITMGVLPPPTLDCTGNANTIYMVDFPPNISLGGPQGAGRSCVNNGFCAYHNTGTFGPSNIPLIYAAVMDVFTGPCSMGCGSNGTGLANATDVTSHELVEAVTDADVGLDLQNNYADPAAWGDNDNNCGEIADICDDGSPGDSITVSGRTWVVQQVWSNKQGKCTSGGAVPPVCSGTTVTGCRPCSCGDNGVACNGATSVCETTSGNVLFGGCEQCTATSGNCLGGGTCQQSTTPSQDDICVGCTPTTTTCPAGDTCGTVPDGCGGVVPCGSCTPPQTCGGGTPSNPNQCGCTPLTACPTGDTCGALPDGCGGMLNCGTCTLPQTCGGGTPSNPNQCGCTSAKACPAGDTCGTAPDGCGGTLNCGSCTPPQTCGGGTPSNPNQCGGCTPLTTCPAGFTCGTVPNLCGGTVSCGVCALPQTCGGGTPSNPNQCGFTCIPLTACPAGFTCGTVPDGCGGTLTCGVCALPQTCGGGTPGNPNQCGCTPLKTCPAGETCGTAPDGCGGVVECGFCAPPESCGGGTPSNPNQCGCTPLKTCPAGDTCGVVKDGCFGVVECGVCSANQVCVGNECLDEFPDAGTSSSSSSSSSGATASSSSSSSGGGAGGSDGATTSSSSSGAAAWIPLYGRAGCSYAATSGQAPDSSAAFLGLAGLACLGARRRRGKRGG